MGVVRLWSCRIADASLMLAGIGMLRVVPACLFLLVSPGLSIVLGVCVTSPFLYLPASLCSGRFLSSVSEFFSEHAVFKQQWWSAMDLKQVLNPCNFIAYK